MYPLIYKYSRLILPRGRAIHRNLQELLQTQWMSAEELQSLQLSKIKRLVDHAYDKIPYYQQLFREIDLHPQDIKTFKDFQQIPPITRQDIKSNPKAFLATNVSVEDLHEGLTGGSTGEPLKFYQDAEWASWTWATVQRNRSWFGFQEGAKQAWLWGRDEDIPSFHVEQLKAWIRRQKWLTSYDTGEEKMGRFAKTLIRFQPEFIFGYTSAVYLFAQFLEKQGITEIRPKAVQTAAEKLHDFQRELIERVFQCKVIDHYAAQEIGAIAAQCLDDGLHIAAETKYLEISVDDRPGEPGELGETVVTDLTNYAMPFIRYKGGDMAILEDKRCACGRGLPLLREVVGRTADFFRMPSGKLVSGLYWTLRMREIPGIKRFQAHQSAIDTIEVIYEIDEGFDEDALEAKREEIINRLDEPISLSFRKVDQIPLTRAGKHLFITSDVPIDLNDNNHNGSE